MYLLKYGLNVCFCSFQTRLSLFGKTFVNFNINYTFVFQFVWFENIDTVFNSLDFDSYREQTAITQC